MIKLGDKLGKGLVKLALTVLAAMGMAGGAMAAERVHSVTHYYYDANNRVKCTALRMNTLVYSDPTFDALDACALSAQRGYGPDRITRNVYDSAGQIVQVLQGYGNTTTISVNGSNINLPFMRAYATYAYSPNGKVIAEIDARGNKTRYMYNSLIVWKRFTTLKSLLRVITILLPRRLRSVQRICMM